MNINQEQLAAIQHGDGPMMVLAGPGSGKTFVITRRIQHLIENHKIEPEQILVITFTKAASLEMQERFEKLMEEPVNVTFGTFHAVYFHILKQHYHYDYSNILTGKEKFRYLKEVLTLCPTEEANEPFMELVIGLISKCKNEGIKPLQMENCGIDVNLFANIYEEYQRILNRENKLDFDDMVLKCRDLFVQYPNVLKEWRERYQYLLIDEFQDINPMQYEVICMIAKPRCNLFIVGDDDQSIYGFRGSKPEIMLHFTTDWENCKTIVLKNNYRSSDGIVNHAMKLVRNNKNRYDKNLIAGREGIDDVVICDCIDREDEAKKVLSIIKEAKQTLPLQQIALIFRTNADARYLSTILGNSDIPFTFKEKMTSIYSHPIAKDILAILAFSHGECTRENFLRFMNKPVRYISRNLLTTQKVVISKMINHPDLKPYVRVKLRELEYQLKTLSTMHPYAAVNFIRKGMGYEEFVLKEAKEKKQDTMELLENMNLILQSAKNAKNYKDWLLQIEDYETMLQNTKTVKDEDSVQLVTMHGSKGLEYQLVILPDLNEGNVPQGKAANEDDLEEERRMFYVAMTRAKDKLYLLYIKKNKENRLIPSRFLKELQ